MNLAKTSFLSFIATAIKLLSGLIINKAISVFIGPAGLALIGQFQNAQGIIRTVAQAGINSGVVKYTAEYHDNKNLRASIWSSSFKITLLCSAITSIVLIVFSQQLTLLTFKTDDYQYVYITFGFTLILYSINQLLLSVLNGLKEIKEYIYINIIQSIYGLLFTTLLIVLWGLDGALIALVTNQSVILLIILWRLRGHALIKPQNFLKPFTEKVGKKLSKYSLMALVSACCVPVSLLIIRNYIGQNLSWQEAGYWQAMIYISTMYLMVITTALSTYYLPRLSEINDKQELIEELRGGFFIILPIVILLSLSVFLLKEFVVWALFTPEFNAMLPLFKWQLIGDTLKITSWLIAYLMLAKAMTKVYIFTEIIFSVMFVVLSIYFVNSYGLIGVTYAYSLNYIVYALAMIAMLKKYLS